MAVLAVPLEAHGDGIEDGAVQRERRERRQQLGIADVRRLQRAHRDAEVVEQLAVERQQIERQRPA